MIEELQWMKGVKSEVQDADCYKLREINFLPDVVIDLGGNIGTFAAHARNLFPNSLIVSVEPNKDNIALYKHFIQDYSKIILIEKAIGNGKMWRYTGERTGTGEVYVNNSIGYPERTITEAIESGFTGMEDSNVPTIMPDEIINTYLKEEQKSVVKIDIEGNELVIWEHEPSMQALMKADYICMEIHQYALTGEILSRVRQYTFESLARFIPTHKCEWINTSFYATKK